MKYGKKWTLPLTIVLGFLLFAAAAMPGSRTHAAQTVAVDTQIETVETERFSMDYFCFGEGERTLVILPGLSVQSVMGSADAVAEAYQPLAEEFTIYLFDRRKELPDPYSIHEMAQDTAEAIRALGLEDICLFGTSQGGMIAMEIAVEYPELVEKLALGSASARVEEAEFETIEHWIELAKAGDPAALYLAFGEALYPQELFEQSRDLLLAAAETVSEEDLERFVILAEGIRSFDITEELDRIACPVLVLGSKDDRVLGGEASELIAEKLGEEADCELVLYDGYGHAAYDLAPDYKERLLNFFAPEFMG